MASLTAAEAEKVQGKDLGSASKDLYEAIERGDYPQWDLYVQMMDDHEHPELDWDPLDDTKIWPEDQFPLRHVGVMTLNRNIEDHHNENEQIAMGTGVLVDGLDFSDDKMLVGRTSRTPTPSVTGSAQLPAAAGEPPEEREGRHQPARRTDVLRHRPGSRPEPARELRTQPARRAPESEREEPYKGPVHTGRQVREDLERQNDYFRRANASWACWTGNATILVFNMIDNLSQAERDVQERMLWHFFLIHDDYGKRVAEGLNMSVEDVRHLPPLAGRQLTDEDQRRLPPRQQR